MMFDATQIASDVKGKPLSVVGSRCVTTHQISSVAAPNVMRISVTVQGVAPSGARAWKVPAVLQKRHAVRMKKTPLSLCIAVP